MARGNTTGPCLQKNSCCSNSTRDEENNAMSWYYGSIVEEPLENHKQRNPSNSVQIFADINLVIHWYLASILRSFSTVAAAAEEKKVKEEEG